MEFINRDLFIFHDYAMIICLICLLKVQLCPGIMGFCKLACVIVTFSPKKVYAFVSRKVLTPTGCVNTAFS